MSKREGIMVVEVHCVAENNGKKIRARIAAYIDDESGERFEGYYDQSYNCQFPRAIREEGRHSCLHNFQYFVTPLHRPANLDSIQSSRSFTEKSRPAQSG